MYNIHQNNTIIANNRIIKRACVTTLHYTLTPLFVGPATTQKEVTNIK